MIKISVITVVKNRVSTIDQAIMSVLVQNYKNYELIVIDGNSTDGTIRRLQNYKKAIKVLISENDKGIYHAMNKGLKYVSGDVVCFLNSDDFYGNNNVFSDVANMFEEKKCDIVYGDIVYVTKQKPHKVIRYWTNLLVSKKSFFIGHHPPHPAFFAKKKLYDNFGDFNAEIIAADFDLMIRLFNNSEYNCYLKKICVVMRLGGVSNTSLKYIISQNYQLIKTLKDYNKRYSILLFLLLKPLLRFYQFFNAIVNKKLISKQLQ